ncbi:MAG: hypothetical protein JO015_20225 [Verrucomicrobia bacterium]|nr:hypothetical protein [Verrucomicrobiota bacterium]
MFTFLFKPDHPADPRSRPGKVRNIRGIVFQSDNLSVLGNWIIRPIEMLDRRLAGLGKNPFGPPLAIHSGVLVEMDDGRQYVAEQLFGTPAEDFTDALNWTPVKKFRERDHRGWDVTVPATAFRNIDRKAISEAITFLNQVKGKPFFGEDCTTFVERVFNKRRIFADSPSARLLGFGVRVGDPALPLLRPDAVLDPKAEFLLRATNLRKLPDPTTGWNAPNWRRALRIFVRVVASAGLWMGVWAIFHRSYHLFAGRFKKDAGR